LQSQIQIRIMTPRHPFVATRHVCVRLQSGRNISCAFSRLSQRYVCSKLGSTLTRHAAFPSSRRAAFLSLRRISIVQRISGAPQFTRLRLSRAFIPAQHTKFTWAVGSRFRHERASSRRKRRTHFFAHFLEITRHLRLLQHHALKTTRSGRFHAVRDGLFLGGGQGGGGGGGGGRQWFLIE
jgi:hypothetical protein